MWGLVMKGTRHSLDLFWIFFFPQVSEFAHCPCTTTNRLTNNDGRCDCLEVRHELPYLFTPQLSNECSARHLQLHQIRLWARFEKTLPSRRLVYYLLHHNFFVL